MHDITVELRAPSEHGRLYPRYDEEDVVLLVQCDGERDWPHYVNFDYAISFDLHGDGVLASIDLIIQRCLWRVVREPFTPIRQRVADIAFTREVIEQRQVEPPEPLEVITDRSRQRVLLRLARTAEAAEAVELSSGCMALVAGNRLVGFYVELSEPAG